MFGDFAPVLVHYTDDVLFGKDWTRQELSPKERSLVTVASLVTSGSTEHLVYYIWNREIDPGRVFDLTLPLDLVAEGYKAMDERGAMKALLIPNNAWAPRGRPKCSRRVADDKGT